MKAEIEVCPLEAVCYQQPDPSTMVAETSDSMPAASILLLPLPENEKTSRLLWLFLFFFRLFVVVVVAVVNKLGYRQQRLTFQNKTCYFSVWLFCYYSDFVNHFYSLFQLYDFYFSSTAFHFSSDDDLFDFLVLVSHEAFLIFCMAWSLLFIYLFLAINMYLLFFSLPWLLWWYQAQLFFFCPHAAQCFPARAFLCHSTHPVCSSFLWPSVLFASGVKLYCEKPSASKNGIKYRGRYVAGTQANRPIHDRGNTNLTKASYNSRDEYLCLTEKASAHLHIRVCDLPEM